MQTCELRANTYDLGIRIIQQSQRLLKDLHLPFAITNVALFYSFVDAPVERLEILLDLLSGMIQIAGRLGTDQG